MVNDLEDISGQLDPMPPHLESMLGTNDVYFLASDVTKAGPQIRSGVPFFVRTPVEFRQHLCPGCFTALLTEVVPAEHEATREPVIVYSAAPLAARIELCFRSHDPPRAVS
jgi:hypothetical protein